MNCPKCGNPIEKDSPYCLKCFALVKPPGFWQRLLVFFNSAKPRRTIYNIKKTVDIKTNIDGEHHEYHSLDEVPAELRAELEKAEEEALKEGVKTSSPDGLKTTWVSNKTVSVIKVKDASGNERIYHSIEELPPELRAALEKARNQTNGPQAV